MGNGIYSAVSGAIGSMRQMEVLSNNLANVSTPGYKRDRLAFKEILGTRLANAQGAPPPSASSFTAVAANQVDFSQGPLKRTDSPLDIALEGPGFVTAKHPQQGVVFSRGGALTITPKGELALAQGGHLVLDDKRKPIKVDPRAGTVVIGREGTLTQAGNPVGKIHLVEFAQPGALERLGGTLYKGPLQQAAPAKATGVRAGFIEKPNVNAVRGVTTMISASRAYEALHRVIGTFREVDSAAARIASER